MSTPVQKPSADSLHSSKETWEQEAERLYNDDNCPLLEVKQAAQTAHITACKMRETEVERMRGLLEGYVKLAAAERFYRGSITTEDNVLVYTEAAWQQFKTKNNI